MQRRVDDKKVNAHGGIDLAISVAGKVRPIYQEGGLTCVKVKPGETFTLTVDSDLNRDMLVELIQDGQHTLDRYLGAAEGNVEFSGLSYDAQGTIGFLAWYRLGQRDAISFHLNVMMAD